MEISVESRIKILTDSFSILKKDIDKNYSQLCEILDQCLIYDENLAVEMWEHLIDTHREAFEAGRGWVAGSVVTEIYMMSGEHISEEKFNNIVFNSEKIRNAVFRFEEYLTCCDKVVAYFIEKNFLEKANILLDCVSQNPNKNDSFAKFLEDVMSQVSRRCYEPLSGNAIDLITHWMGTVSDQTEKARLNVSLIKLIPSSNKA